MTDQTGKNAVITVEGFSHGTTETRIRAGEFEFLIDEPESFGGQDKAPSPVAYLLGAVCGCVVAIGTQASREMGITIRNLNTRVDGTIDSSAFFGISFDQRSGFSEIIITLEVDSDADPKRLSLWKQAVLERCPVIDNLINETRVIIR